jgi:hypothetical protein
VVCRKGAGGPPELNQGTAREATLGTCSPSSLTSTVCQVIEVQPLGRGLFAARLDGRLLVASSRQPFLDAARILLAGIRADHDRGRGDHHGDHDRGDHDRGRGDADHSIDIIVMRHGSGTESLRARLEVAARLTIEESDRRPPRFKRWRPRNVGEGSARIADDDRGATTLPEAAE